MSDIVERLRRRAETAEALSDTMQDTTARAWQVEAMAVLMRVSRDQSEAADEIERLTACLQVANANHERFERLWYLEKDKVEALTSPQLHQHGGGVTDEMVEAACLERYSRWALIPEDEKNHARVKMRRWVRAALAQQPLSVPARGGEVTDWWQEWVKLTRTHKALRKAAQLVVDQTDSIHDNEPWPLKYRAPYEAITALRSLLSAAPAHPTQSDVSCSRAREGGTE